MNTSKLDILIDKNDRQINKYLCFLIGEAFGGIVGNIKIPLEKRKNRLIMRVHTILYIDESDDAQAYYYQKISKILKGYKMKHKDADAIYNEVAFIADKMVDKLNAILHDDIRFSNFDIVSIEDDARIDICFCINEEEYKKHGMVYNVFFIPMHMECFLACCDELAKKVRSKDWKMNLDSTKNEEGYAHDIITTFNIIEKEDAADGGFVIEKLKPSESVLKLFPLAEQLANKSFVVKSTKEKCVYYKQVNTFLTFMLKYVFGIYTHRCNFTFNEWIRRDPTRYCITLCIMKDEFEKNGLIFA